MKQDMVSFCLQENMVGGIVMGGVSEFWAGVLQAHRKDAWPNAHTINANGLKEMRFGLHVHIVS